MTRVTVAQGVLAKLSGLNGQVELVDELGWTLGVFTPTESESPDEGIDSGGTMNKITVDQAMLAKLSGLNGQLELVNESGQSLGVLTRADTRSLYEGIEIPFSEEEMTRRANETTRFTTQEVLARLKALEASS